MNNESGDKTGTDNESDDEKDKGKNQYYKALRELRAETQDFRDLLVQIKAGKTTTKENTDYFKKTYTDIKKLINEITDLNQKQRSDTCRRILNSWEKMQVNPVLKSPDQDRDAQDELHNIAILDEEAGKIILYVGHITIPHRLNRWISASRPGHYLPFHLLFEDEIPTLSDRAKVLNTIAWAPKAIKDGLVYPGSGLVYRYEVNPIKRWGSFFQIFLVFALMTAFIVELCFIGDQFAIKNWIFKPEHAKYLIIGWIAVIVGVIVHIGVESVKRSQITGLPPVVAINDWLLHVSARKGDIILKLLIALFGLFGLIFTTDIDKLTTMSAFLVGYSLDSFVGLFGTSIEQKAAAHATALKEQLGIKPAG